MSSPVEPAELSENPAPAPTAGSADPVDPRILAEQVHQLYSLGRTGSFTIFVGLVCVWLPFAPHVAGWTILPPLLIQLAAQLSFNRLRARYDAAPKSSATAEHWGEQYARRCLLSGLTWGVAAILWLPNAPFPPQALFGLAVAALCLLACLTRHVYPRAMFTYSITSLGPTFATLLVTGGIEAQIMSALGLLTWAAMLRSIRGLNRASIETISLRFTNSNLVESLADAKEIAEQKARDAEQSSNIARKAARSRRDFLSMVTHEIRSPLASLSGLVHLLESTELDAQQRSYARGVQESSVLLNRLVNDLGDLTEMEALSIRLRPVDMSPAEIARAAVHLMRHEATSRRLSIEVDELPGTPSAVHNDPDRVKQALVNLISRALRTTESGGVVVRLSPVDIAGGEPGVRFSVSDTSLGMPPEDAARLFSSLDFDEDRGPHRRPDVNLTICDRLVRLMGGRIGADSVVGGGFTAWFLLSCSPPERKSPSSMIQLSTQPGQGQMLDLDRVYELEQELGTGRIAEYLNVAIGNIADIQKRVADACRAGDRTALKAAADALTIEANAIGLTGLSESASYLCDEAEGAASMAALADKADQLEAKFLSGTRALTRAYPALA